MEQIMSYDGRYHRVEIGGLTRELPLFEVAPNVKIAIFNMLGDTEIVEHAADALVEKIPSGAQVLVTPEVKAVPLAMRSRFAAGCRMWWRARFASRIWSTALRPRW
jgi:hypothetical protein